MALLLDQNIPGLVAEAARRTFGMAAESLAIRIDKAAGIDERLNEFILVFRARQRRHEERTRVASPRTILSAIRRSWSARPSPRLVALARE